MKLFNLLKYEIVLFNMMTENQLISIVYLGSNSDWYYIHYSAYHFIILWLQFDYIMVYVIIVSVIVMAETQSIFKVYLGSNSEWCYIHISVHYWIIL